MIKAKKGQKTTFKAPFKVPRKVSNSQGLAEMMKTSANVFKDKLASLDNDDLRAPTTSKYAEQKAKKEAVALRLSFLLTGFENIAFVYSFQ